jgi:predicted aldo/keto reductase-like oxidoreductase
MNHDSSVRYRRLGRTALMVSEVALDGDLADDYGVHPWSRPGNSEMLAAVAKNCADVISRCIDHGINYIDITYVADAIAYGMALKGRRGRMFIAADDSTYAMRVTRHRNPDGQMKSIESCLWKLDTDYLDVWRPQFKPVGGHRDVELEMCVSVFEKARSQGKARFLGMSSSDHAWIQHVIGRFPEYRVVYVPCVSNPRDEPWWLKGPYPAFSETARAQDVGVILTNPFGVSGRGVEVLGGATEADQEAARSTLTTILSNPDISAVAVRMRTPGHVDNCARVLSVR